MLANVALVAAGGALVGSAIRKHSKRPSLVAQLVGRSRARVLRPSSFEDESLREVMMSEQDANQRLAVSAAAMGFAALASLGLGAFNVLAIPLLVYPFWPLMRAGYYQTFKVRKIGIATIDLVTLPLLIGSGYILASGMYIFLYYLSIKLVTSTRRKSEEALTSIFEEIPNTAWILVDGMTIEVSLSQIHAGDLVVAQAGQVIPIDGEIQSGVATVDQHMLTGESQPAEKEPGDRVFAATSVLAGEIVIKVERTGTDTVAAEIEDLLHKTANYESTSELQGQSIADRTALPMLVLGAVTWPLLGAKSMIAVLLCYFGIDLRVTAPLSVLNHLQVASRNRILIKDGRALEALQTVNTIVFDKTGTLTQEQPQVAEIYAYNGYSSDQVLQYAAAVEAKQMHPIARAICQAAEEQDLDVPAIDEAAIAIGFGLKARIGGQALCLGSRRFMEMEAIPIPASVEGIQAEAHAVGRSLVYLASDGVLIGVIELHPTIRAEIRPIIESLKQRQMQTYIISGDQRGPTEHLAQSLGIDGFYAEVLPEEKAKLVAQLQQEGRTVCFVGDGINDSIALKKANVSISLRGASTIAMDTAQIVLLDGSLAHLPQLFEIGENLQENMKGNLAWAIAPGVVLLGGVYFLHLGVLSTMFLGYVGFGGGLGNAMLPRIRPMADPTAPGKLAGTDATDGEQLSTHT